MPAISVAINGRDVCQNKKKCRQNTLQANMDKEKNNSIIDPLHRHSLLHQALRHVETVYFETSK